jgi:hypothetical protein
VLCFFFSSLIIVTIASNTITITTNLTLQ